MACPPFASRGTAARNGAAIPPIRAGRSRSALGAPSPRAHPATEPARRHALRPARRAGASPAGAHAALRPAARPPAYAAASSRLRRAAPAPQRAFFPRRRRRRTPRQRHDACALRRSHCRDHSGRDVPALSPSPAAPQPPFARFLLRRLDPRGGFTAPHTPGAQIALPAYAPLSRPAASAPARSLPAPGCIKKGGAGIDAALRFSVRQVFNFPPVPDGISPSSPSSLQRRD